MTVRTLVIDDSPTMRAMLSSLLASDPEIEVIGTAPDTAVARTLIKELDPDVITLDVEMPGMNGLDFLEKIMRLRPTPVVMVSTLTQKGADATIRALELGAFDCYPKPTDSFREAAHRDRAALPQMVKGAARARRRAAGPIGTTRPPEAYRPRADALVAIGSSTGGVEALAKLLGQWPVECPPTLIVQHMPALFTKSFTARLDRLCAARVVEAQAGAPLLPGHVYVAPGGERHLEVLAGSPNRCRLVSGELFSGHRPSVDRLFQSVASAVGASAVGAILTGMGSDGARGLCAMRDAGAVTVGQDEATCVVYGMPGSAKAMGAVEVELPLERIAGRLLAECQA